MQAVKAEDVGTAQRLLQRPRPGKASECGGRGRAGATAGAGPPTPPGAGRRGGCCRVPGGGAGPAAPRPSVRTPAPSAGGGAAPSARRSPGPRAGNLAAGVPLPPRATG